MDTAKNNLPEIAFIVGMGRSGTTLLTNMLNSHPEVIATPENEFLLFSFSSFFNQDFNASTTVRSFVSLCSLNFSKIVSIWKPSAELYTDINALTEKNYANVCKLVYLNYPLAGKNKQTTRYVIDKNPIYSLHIPKLNAVYPKAKYIVLVRDFRDNAVSRKKYGKPGDSIYKLAASWNYFYEKIFADLSQYHPDHLIVRYEDLAADPENTLKTICSHLDIPYAESMLHFQDLISKTRNHAKEHLSGEVYDKITQMHSNLDKDVNTNRVKAYEKELSGEEISILNYCCRQLGTRFQYLSSTGPLPAKFLWKYRFFMAKRKVKLYYFLKNIYFKLPVSLRIKLLKKQVNQSS